SVETRTLMESRHLMVLSPACTIDPSLAIAACRAGAVGGLDLEFAADTAIADEALDRLVRFAAGSAFGVLIRTEHGEQSARFLTAATKPSRIILTGPPNA